MTETVVGNDAEPAIDEELLAEAQRHLGGQSRNAAVNAALRMFVEHWRTRRGSALDRLQAMADEGLVDFGAIDEVDR